MIPRYKIDFSAADMRAALSIRGREKPFLPEGISWILPGCPARLSWDGRTALRIILRAMRLQPGEPVAVPLWTCCQVRRAIEAEGGRPVFVKIGKGRFMPDAAGYAECVSQNKARIVVAISYWGYPADITALKLKLPSGTVIIQDCALSFGSEAGGVPDGAHADAAFYSFGIEKPFCLGTGGAAVFSTAPGSSETVSSVGNFEILKLFTRIAAKRAFFGSHFLYGAIKSLPARVSPPEPVEGKPSDTLAGAPGWMLEFAQARLERFRVQLAVKKNKWSFLKNLLKGAPVSVMDEAPCVSWNVWLPPFLLPENISAAEVSRNLCNKGFEAIVPYKDSNDETAPNIFTGPSLELMSEEEIRRFARAVPEAAGV